MTRYPLHPLCEMFPRLPRAELEVIAADIRANGLRRKITLWDGHILDGQNRQEACALAGVEPEFEEFTGDTEGAVALVLSENVYKRHLEPEQRAIAVARAMKWLKEEAARRRAATLRRGNSPPSPPAGGNGKGRTAAADAAKLAKVSERSMERAMKVAAQGSKELQDAVAAGKVKLGKAEQLAKLSAEEQIAAVNEDSTQALAERPGTNLPKLGDQFHRSLTKCGKQGRLLFAGHAAELELLTGNLTALLDAARRVYPDVVPKRSIWPTPKERKAKPEAGAD